jgi:hypothetical protein
LLVGLAADEKQISSTSRLTGNRLIGVFSGYWAEGECRVFRVQISVANHVRCRADVAAAPFVKKGRDAALSEA